MVRQLFPQEEPGKAVGRLTHLLVVGSEGEVFQESADAGHGLGGVGIVPFHDEDPVFVLYFHVGHPAAETRKGSGERRDTERDAFHGRVAPRFVVGGEYRNVESDQQVVVGKIEHAVVSVQVAREENHLHLVFGPVLQA